MVLILLVTDGIVERQGENTHGAILPVCKLQFCVLVDTFYRYLSCGALESVVFNSFWRECILLVLSCNPFVCFSEVFVVLRRLSYVGK